MNTFLFTIQGKPPALAELKALFETYNLKSKILKQRDNLITIQSNAKPEDIIKLCERSSHITDASILIKELKDLKLNTLSKINWSFVQMPFAVRVKDLMQQERFGIERRLAMPIWRHFIANKKNPSVNLDRPKTTVHFIIGEKIFLTRKLWENQSGKYKKREPQKRPAFHPTTLKPKTARLIINLARVKEHELLLDPFCGIGAIPIEADQFGIQVIASDFDKKMLSGAKSNFKFYKKFGNTNFLNSDVKDLDKHLKNKVDAIATDPPYGRSSKVKATSIIKLYKMFLDSSSRVLKKGGHAAFFYPHYVKVNKLVNGKKWQTVAKSEIYAHGGLTRKILVLKLR
ncbi:MAG: RsmD family RNA methyltransferase [DPANN group archaeon]|nr:RsmD family RNA methyltransferase [DPANN group archaeon]